MTQAAIDRATTLRPSCARSRPATRETRSGLLPMLHLVQSVEGRVTPEGIEACAEILGITAAEVSGVATFYTMYKRRPVGDYHVGVCTNTLCAVMGGDVIFERLKEHLDVGNDETTDATAKITLEHVECNAACDYAPVMMVNWEFMDNMTPESAVRARRRPAGRARRSTPPAARASCTWREAERVLAGFPDDLADEGPAAGPASPGRPRHRPRARLDRARRRRQRPHRQRAPTPTEAVEQADTARAETETEQEEDAVDRHADPGPHRQLGRRSAPGPSRPTRPAAATAR